MMPKTCKKTFDYGDDIFENFQMMLDMLKKVSDNAKDIFQNISNDDEDKFG